MKRRAILTGLAALAMLTACVNQGGTGLVKPGKASGAPSANPAVVPTTPIDTTLKPSELISKTRLQAPKTPSTLVSGTVSIDAGYVVASGAGRIVANDGASIVMPSALIGQDAAGLLGQDGAGVVAGGAGNIIANDGASIIANDGASIIANDGSSLIGQDGAGIVAGGAGNYGLLQAGASATAGQQLPGAGMWVRVINLADNRPVSLGVDENGRDVFVVMTDAKGRYALHLPESLKQNVRIVASIPRSDDPRLTYNMVADPEGSKDARYDESAALTSTYVRLAMVTKLDFLASELTANYDLNRIQIARDPVFGDLAKPFLKEMLDRALAAGITALPPARKSRVVQRFSDQLVSLTELKDIAVIPDSSYTPVAGERSVEALTALFERITTATATRMAAGDINRMAYLVEVNGKRTAQGLAPYVIRKPSDMARFITEEFVGNPDGARVRLGEVVFDDLGLPVREFNHLRAVYSSIYAALALNMFTNEDHKAAMLNGLEAMIKEEGSARAPRLPATGAADKAPYPLPVPAVESYDVTTLTGQAGGGFQDGPAESAQHGGAWAMAFGPDGALYFSDPANGAIRKIDLADPAHPVSTVAGPRAAGGDGPVGTAGMGAPHGLAFDLSATSPVLYFSDVTNRAIRKLTLPGQGEAGVVTTLAGPETGLTQPLGISLDGKGGLFVSDAKSTALSRLSLTGASPTLTRLLTGESPNHLDLFNYPVDVKVSGHGDAYIVDNGANAVLRLRGDRLTLIAGSTARDVTDGYYASAKFAAPGGAAFVPAGLPDAGSLIVTDAAGHRVRRIRLDEVGGGLVSTLAGGGPVNEAGQGAFADGPGAAARFNTPGGVVVGPDGTIYVADQRNNRIRMLKPRVAD